MTLNVPFLASPLQAFIPDELAGLTARSKVKLVDADKKLGVHLLAETYCDLIDVVFTRLLDDIAKTHQSVMLTEAHAAANEIKEKTRHYLGWVVGFISNDRLIPVIAHFNQLVHKSLEVHGERRAYVAFPISPTLAAEARRVLNTLHDGSAKDVEEGIELLIHFIEEVLEPAVLIPKRLMKFNFVVDKTLTGVISLIMTLFKRMLRKLAPHIPRPLYPQVASHLERFLIIDQPQLVGGVSVESC